MKICKSHPKRNMPQYGIECTIGQKGPGWMALQRLHWGIVIKIANRSSPRRTSRKWGDKCATPSRSVNLIQDGNMSQYSVECVIDQKIRWHQIIHHQTHDPDSPNTTESDLNIKEATPRRRSMTISKYRPDLKHLSK